jgi:hypothetical protein
MTWRHRDGVFNSLLWTALVTIVVLFLFTRVCGNLSNIIRGQPRTFDWYSTSVMLLAVGASFVACLENDFATEERILTLGLQLYTLICILLLVGPRAWAHTKLGEKPISPAKSSLQADRQPLLPGPSHMDTSSTGASSTDASSTDATTQDTRAVDTSAADPSQADINVNTTGALTTVLLVLTAHLQNTYHTPFLGIFVVIFWSCSFLKFLNLVLLHTKHAKSSRFYCLKFLLFCIDTLVFVSQQRE